MQRIARKKLTRLLSMFVLAVLVSAMCAGGNFSTRAYADTGKELNYDNTNVLDDLGGSAIDGEPFNVNDYPRNPFGTAQMITFVEYCYSQYDNGFGNYALYVYIYNPALVDMQRRPHRIKSKFQRIFSTGMMPGKSATSKTMQSFL